MIVGTDMHTLATALEACGISIDTSHKKDMLIDLQRITVGTEYDGGITFYFHHGATYSHYEVHSDGSALADGRREGWSEGYEAGRNYE